MQISKNLVEFLQKAVSETHGTSLITYYVQQSDIWLVTQQLCEEISSAQNIKCKDVRKAVISALKSGMYLLRNIKENPSNLSNLSNLSNGVVLLAGDLDHRF